MSFAKFEFQIWEIQTHIWNPKCIQIKKLWTTKFLNFSRSTTLLLWVSSSEVIWNTPKILIQNSSETLCRVYFYGTRQSLFLPSANKIHSAKKLSKKDLKIPNGLENLPKFHVKQSMLSIAYTKSFELKQQFDHQFDSNSYRIILNSMIFLRRCIGL